MVRNAGGYQNHKNFEWQMMMRIFGPLHDNGAWRIRINAELGESVDLSTVARSFLGGRQQPIETVGPNSTRVVVPRRWWWVIRSLRLCLVWIVFYTKRYVSEYCFPSTLSESSLLIPIIRLRRHLSMPKSISRKPLAGPRDPPLYYRRPQVSHL